MSSEKRALEIVKALAENIQAANEAGIQAVIHADALFGDDDETTLGDAILACAGVEAKEEKGKTVDDLVAWLNDWRSASGPFEYSTGQKMAKITHNGGWAYAFVALTNFSNKTLGNVTKGQIFKAASWKAPARHARADLARPDQWFKALGTFGVAYLR